MKKLLISLALVLAVSTFGAIKSVGGYDDSATFHQFTYDAVVNVGDYTDGSNPGQTWLGAQTIELHINSSMDVWVSNYVNSWYSQIANLDANVYDMNAEKYGATEINGSKEWLGSGATTDVLYSDGAGHENSTKAYFLGHFAGGEDIYLWMTTLQTDGHELVTAGQYVQDANHDTTLVSRVNGTYDLAGNVRLNFGIDSESIGFIGREFVAFGVMTGTDDMRPTGQPLPGVWATLLFAGCAAGFIKKKNRKKNN